MSINDIALEKKTKDDQSLQAAVGSYYKSKYPGKIEKPAEGETALPMSAEERQESDRKFHDGMYFANQQKNADMLSKLRDVFAGRNKGGK